MAKVGRNRAPRIMSNEHKDFDLLQEHEFPWTLVLPWKRSAGANNVAMVRVMESVSHKIEKR